MTSELNGSRIVGLSSVKDAPNRRDSTTSCDDMSGVSDVESKLHPQSVEPCHNLTFNTIRYNPAIVGNQLTNSAPIHFAVPQSSTFPGFPRLPPPAKVDEGEVHLPHHSTRLVGLHELTTNTLFYRAVHMPLLNYLNQIYCLIYKVADFYFRAIPWCWTYIYKIFQDSNN